VTRRLALRLGLGLVLAGGLAACGGSTKTVVHTVHVPATTAHATSTASTTTPTTPTTPTTATTPPATTSACVAADLSLAFVGQQGAAGHGELGFALKNTSASACHTYGYPGVLFLDSAGNGLTTIPQHTTLDYFGHSRLGELTLQPGQEVSFRLGVTHGAVPGSVCTTAAGLQVIAPDDTATLRITIPSGAYECRNVTVSPLQAGTSAYR
jgi:Protein of unknown function (DUF4232)